jgi:hypothetical protein
VGIVVGLALTAAFGRTVYRSTWTQAAVVTGACLMGLLLAIVVCVVEYYWLLPRLGR